MRRAIWTRLQALLVPWIVLVLLSALSGAGRVAAASDGDLPVRSVARAPAAGEITPTVVGLDAGAAALRPLVEKHLADLIDLTGVQMGWRPAVPITVYVATDVDVAVATAERIGAYGPYARVGISQTQWPGDGPPVDGPAVGRFIMLNLIHPDLQRESYIRSVLAHEWTHAAQKEIGGVGNTNPIWFMEGQAVYQELRNGTDLYGVVTLLQAVQDERQSVAPRLLDLGTSSQWAPIQAARGDDSTYGRGYAAVRYLADVYGFDMTVALLKYNRQDQARFWQVLRDFTALDPRQFDQAVSLYLRSQKVREAAALAGGFTVQYVALPERSSTLARIQYSATGPCAEAVAAKSPKPWSELKLTQSPGDALTAQWRGDGGFSLTQIGWLGTDGTLSGVMYVDDAESGCHGGPQAYGSTRVLTGSATDGSAISFGAIVSSDWRRVRLVTMDGASSVCSVRRDLPSQAQRWTTYDLIVQPDGSFGEARMSTAGPGIVSTLRGRLNGSAGIDVELAVANPATGCEEAPWQATLM